MSKEIKIGILAIITAVIAVWGYKYLKGRNLLEDVNVYHIVYPNVERLTVASPVMVNGYQVGAVSKIKLNPKDVNSIIVTIEVIGEIDYPKHLDAVLASAGLVDGKMITLELKSPCSGADCAPSGHTFQGVNRGMIEAMIGTSDISQYTDNLKSAVAGVMDTLNDQLQDKNSTSPINQSLWAMETTMKNMESMTKQMNRLMSQSTANLEKTIANMAEISDALLDNRNEISSVMENVAAITADLKQASIGTTMSKTNLAIDSTTQMISNVSATLTTANDAFSKLDELMVKMDSGDGSLSQLLNDRQLYNNLESTSKNLSLLLQDMRLNPKRYVRFSVFGRNNKEYQVPEDDPAFNDDKSDQ